MRAPASTPSLSTPACLLPRLQPGSVADGFIIWISLLLAAPETEMAQYKGNKRRECFSQDKHWNCLDSSKKEPDKLKASICLFAWGAVGGVAGSGKGECKTLVKTGQSGTPVTEALPHRGAPPGGGGRARGSSQRHESAYSFRPRTSPRDPQKWLFLVNPGCGQEAGLVTHFPTPPGRKQNRPGPEAFATETQATVWRPRRSKSPLLNLQFPLGKLRQGRRRPKNVPGCL